MLKFKTRNLLTVILTALIAVLFVLAAVPYISKTTKTASADAVISDTTLDELAVAAGYKDYDQMSEAIDDVTSLNASNFGDYVITFGGMEWWPVLASASGDDNLILTLWLKTSEDNYTFSDGTYGNNSTYAANNYTYSWIRAAINAGQTDLGYYYGNWPDSTTSTAEPTQYSNNVASDSGKVCAPTDFVSFANFVSGGMYSQYIVAGAEGDNVWLPSPEEVKSGGTWGLSSTQWSTTSTSTYCWLRPAYQYNYRAYLLNASGSLTYGGVHMPYGVRPAININLSAVATRVSPADVEVSYNGSNQSISDADPTDVKWFNSDRVTLSYHSDISCTGESISPIDAGEYFIKVTLNNDLDDDGNYIYKFKSTVDPDGSYNAQRWMPVKFTINKKKLSVKFTYDADGLPSVAWSATLFPNDTGNEPVLGLKYESTTGAAISDPYSVPTAIGTYKAVAYIVDEASHSYNYELDTSTATSNTFTVTARKITDPVSTTGSATKTVTYNAASQTMTLQNISADVKYTLSTGLVEDSYDSSTGTLTVSATNAGTYTVKADLADGGAGTVWSSGGTATKTFTLQINKATLTATITGLPASWGEGTAQTATVTLTGFHGSDTISDVSLAAQYKNSSSAEVSVAGSGGSFILPNDLAQGNYTFSVDLEANKNYQMSAATFNFTVTAPDADFNAATDIVWQYRFTGSLAVTVPSNLGTATDPYVVIYAGEAYEFSLTLDSAALAVKGVKATYTGDTSAINASNALYHIVLTVSAKDSSVSYTTTTHDFYFRIDKAKFDLSGVQWNYDPANPLQYTGSSQTVTLKASTIPAGLTASYAKNGTALSSGIGVGLYSVRVSFTASDTINYLEPDYSDPTTYEGTFDFVCNFEIVKQKINIVWTNNPEKDANGNDIFVYRLSSNEDLIDYSFEYMNASGSYVACGDPEYVEGTEVQYKVTVTLKSAYAASYELVGTTYKEFSVGKDKYAVEISVTLNGSPLDGSTDFVYNGSPFVAVPEIISGYVTLSDFVIKYYNSNGALLSSAPSEAGDYKVVVELNASAADDNIITSDSEFGFTIAKATIDTSNVKWGYIGNDGQEHELTADTILEYMREGGSAKDYQFLLINLPAELDGLITYKLNSISGNSVANVGTYQVEYIIGATDTKNYEVVTMPSSLNTKQIVEIVERDLGKPEFDGSWTEFDFSADPKNILELCGMVADGVGVYYNVSIKFNGEVYNGYDGDPYAVIHAGKYVVVYDVIKLSGETGNNVTFGGTVKTQEVEIEIAKQTVTVTGWTGDEETSKAKFDLIGAAVVVGTRLEDENGNVYTQDEFYSAPAGSTFYAVPYVLDGYENDVEIVIKPGVAEKIEFSSLFEMTSQTKLIDKPYFEIGSIEYDGNSHEFKIIGLDGWEDYIYISDGDDLTQTESGSYSVNICFITGVDACWSNSTKDNVDRKAITLNFEITKKSIYIPEIEDHTYSGNEIDVWEDIKNAYGDFVIMISGDYFATDAGSYSFVLQLNTEKYGDNIEWKEQTATTVKHSLAGATLTYSSPLSADKTQVTVQWEILKAVISGVWQKDGTLKLTIPGYNGPIDGLILYTYTDADGYLVAAEDRVSGQTYNSSAQLNPDFANNFEFDDATKQATSTPNAGAYDPTNGQSAKSNPLETIKAFMTAKAFGLLPVWSLFLIGLLLLILLIIVIAAAKKRSKNKEEKAAIKERKEEERQMRKEKLEAERELAKAKQEAELEKIRAQAGLAGVGAMGAASKTTAQPQARQMPAQQPVQTNVGSDNAQLIAELKAEVAELRARQGAGYAQPTVQQPAQFASDPVAAAELIRLKAESEANMRAELERARLEAERAKAEAEIAKVRAENNRFAPYAQQFGTAMFAPNSDMEKIGALAVSIWRNMQAQADAEVRPVQSADESAKAAYPSDAVVTTTTTVDTTKSKPIARSRKESREERSEFTDVDGFYDSFDGN